MNKFTIRFLLENRLTTDLVTFRLISGFKIRSITDSSKKLSMVLFCNSLKLIRWVKDQYDRRGGFIRIFPRAETWSAYGGLLGENVFQIELLKKITPCKSSFQEQKKYHIKMTQEISKDHYK